MALFKSKSEGSPKDPLQVLSGLKDQADPVRVEIERTPFYFYTRLVMRSGMVMMTMPVRIQPNLKDKEWVRIGLGESVEQELRLQVSSQEKPEMGNLVRFYCRLPSATLQTRRRSNPRYNTSQFKDLLLNSAQGGSYRVLDLSANGLRVRFPQPAAAGEEQTTPPEEQGPFILGKAQQPGGVLRLGSKTALALEEIIPRYLGPNSGGFEYTVEGGTRSEKILTVFMEALDDEVRRISAPEESGEGASP